MPAIAILPAAVYLAIEAFVARFVYREASARNRRSPLAIAVGVFVFSTAAVFILSSVLLVFLIQAVAIGMYLLGASRKRTATPR